ncbi:hypothetical protein ACROYT_G001360 [Oculina patagonica]
MFLVVRLSMNSARQEESAVDQDVLGDSYPVDRHTKRKQKSELPPPTPDSLTLHLKGANYQAFVWRNSLVAMLNLELPSPENHRWPLEDEALKPVLMNEDPAPRSILELITCNCKKSESRSRCSCNMNGLSCTEACFCMADVAFCRVAFSRAPPMGIRR